MDREKFNITVNGKSYECDRSSNWDRDATPVGDTVRGAWIREVLDILAKRGWEPGDSTYIFSGDSVVFARINGFANHNGTHDVEVYSCIVKEVVDLTV